MKFAIAGPLVALVAASSATAGPLAYAVCQTGCNAIVVACYAAGGATFGVAPPVAIPALMGCNVALGTCMAACAATALIAPTP